MLATFDTKLWTIYSGANRKLARGSTIIFGLVLWHINHSSLFDTKSFLYLYIKYMISKHIFLKTFLNESELIFLYN